MSDLRYRSVNGLALLEVLLAVLILAVGLTAVLQAMMAHARAASEASEYVQAVHALDQRMMPTLMSQTSFDAAEEQGPCGSGSEKFQCSMTSNGTVPSPHPQITFQNISARVHWASGNSEKGFQAAVYLPKVTQ